MANNYFDFLEQNAQPGQSATSASGNDETVNLTTRADAECQVVCDGDFLFLLNPNQITKEKAPVGQHILQYISTEYPDIIIEKVVDFPESGKNYLVMVNEFRDMIAERKKDVVEKTSPDIKKVEKHDVVERTLILTKNELSLNAVFVTRVMSSYDNYRSNPDGQKFYACKYEVSYKGHNYILDESYSFAEGLSASEMGPVIGIDGNTVFAFVSEKDDGNSYGMNGYIFFLEGGHLVKTPLFTHANRGWFPYFCPSEGPDLCFKHFSFAERIQWTAYVDTLNTDIYQPEPNLGEIVTPDTCKNRQNEYGLVYVK